MTSLPVTRIACDALHCSAEQPPTGSGPAGWVHLPGRENPDGRTGRDYCPDHARMSLIPTGWFE